MNLSFLIESIGIVLEQSQAEAVDAAKRRAQIVRDRIGECFQLFVGSSELRSTFLNALLQLIVSLLQSPIALLNLPQHLVERSDQDVRFVPFTGWSRAHSIVFLARNDSRNLG